MNDRELRQLIQEYRARYLKSRCLDWKWYSGASNIRTAIERACISDEEGKVHSHQRRVGRVVLRRFAERLVKNSQKISTAKSFRELHDIVNSSKIRRIGKLTVYDVSERIGYFCHLAPESVYLHAGAAAGARALGLTWNEGILTVGELPPALRKLPPFEVENFLCIFKDRLRGFKSAKPSSCAPPRRRRSGC